MYSMAKKKVFFSFGNIIGDGSKEKEGEHAQKKKTSEPIGKKIGRWGMLCCREHSSVPPGAAHEKHSSCAKWNEEKQSAGMLYLHGGVLPYRNVRSITKCTKIRARLTVQTQRGFSFFSAIYHHRRNPSAKDKRGKKFLGKSLLLLLWWWWWWWRWKDEGVTSSLSLE